MTTRLDIRNEDCIDAMATIVDESVDVIVTSPPYNIGTQYASYKDKLTMENYLEWTGEWLTEAVRCLKPEGSIFLNLGASYKAPELPFFVINLIFQREILVLQNTIHWVKSIALPEGTEEHTRGHVKPVNSDKFVNNGHEYVFHLTKTGAVTIDRLAIGVPYADKSNVHRWKGTGGVDLKCRGNLWFVPYKTIQNSSKSRPHPATFPQRLVENCILLHGKQNAVVMDPFLGLGTSALAAIERGASVFHGFELDSEYADKAAIAARRALDLKYPCHE